MTESPTESTLRPDGWVGNPAALAKARRYRAATKWTTLGYVAALVAAFLIDVPLWWLPFVLFAALFTLDAFLASRVSRAIGRRWSLWRESREGRQVAKDPRT